MACPVLQCGAGERRLTSEGAVEVVRDIRKNDPPETLDDALAQMRALDLGRDLPPCDVVVIYEPRHDDFDEASALRVDAARLVSADAYRERFVALMAAGYPWINLDLAGVFGGRWVVCVELPREPTRAAHTTVTLSGPTRGVVARGGWLAPIGA